MKVKHQHICNEPVANKFDNEPIFHVDDILPDFDGSKGKYRRFSFLHIAGHFSVFYSLFEGIHEESFCFVEHELISVTD